MARDAGTHAAGEVGPRAGSVSAWARGESPPAFSHEALPVRIMFGAGASRRLGDALDRPSARTVVVLASPRHADAVEGLVAGLQGAQAHVFTDVRPHVPEGLAAAARAFVVERSADTVVSVGGGSSVGLAKAVALEVPVEVVAVPTTYSGSEMTPIWGRTADGHKQTGRDPAVLPGLVVYDPALTRSLPPTVAAASGLNAVAHCVEALYAPGRDPISDVIAVEGLRRLVAALPRVVHAGDDQALADALLGACLAGLALGQAGTSLHHKLCHVLGGRFDLPHAETHAAVLAHSVRVAAEHFPAALRPAAEVLDGDPAEGVAALAADLGAPASLATLGLVSDDVDEAIDLAAPVLSQAVEGLTRAQVARLVRGAYDGRLPRL